MKEFELSDELWNQLFGIRRSQRYHERRESFFDALHRTTSLTTILLAGVVLMEVAGYSSPIVLQTLAVIGALLGAGDLIVSFGRRAREHRDWRRRFVDLEAKLFSGAAAEKIRADRLRVERTEPPIYRALDVLCHNEMCVSMGCRNYVRRLPWMQRATAQLFHWSGAGTNARFG